MQDFEFQTDPKGLRVLIVDDERINLMVLEAVCSKLGMIVSKAESGLAALTFCQQQMPDLILMDVMMPVMNGIDATKAIKQISAGRWVPILMVTAMYSRDDIIRGLEAGADDYLMKPVDYQILKTKIANIALVIHQQKALREYREQAELDSQMAMEVMNKLIRPVQLGEKLQYWLKPTANFSGDVVVAGATPNGKTQAILADGTGHGLAAALNVIPVVDVFYGMNDKGLPIEMIARELNQTILQVIPTGRFVAAAMLSIDEQEGTIRVWNGGIPFVAFMSNEGDVLHFWRSVQPPLGLMADEYFENAAEVFRAEQDGYLFVCSDGLLEATNETSDEVGEERLLAWLKAAEGDKIAYVVEQLSRHLGTRNAHDDVSFLIAPFTLKR